MLKFVLAPLQYVWTKRKIWFWKEAVVTQLSNDKPSLSRDLWFESHWGHFTFLLSYKVASLLQNSHNSKSAAITQNHSLYCSCVLLSADFSLFKILLTNYLLSDATFKYTTKKILSWKTWFCHCLLKIYFQVKLSNSRL